MKKAKASKVQADKKQVNSKSDSESSKSEQGVARTSSFGGERSVAAAAALAAPELPIPPIEELAFPLSSDRLCSAGVVSDLEGDADLGDHGPLDNEEFPDAQREEAVQATSPEGVFESTDDKVGSNDGKVESTDKDDGTLVAAAMDDNEQATWDWLEGLDGGRGSLLQYFGTIKSEFDADFTQIAAARLDTPSGPGALGSIEPSFFEALGVTKAGHKMLFAKGILALQ